MTRTHQTDRPLVSVIIPAFQAEGFIQEALESVEAQTLRDLEVVVVDDGSTDGTATVVSAFGRGVRLVRQKNAGASAARNRGIAETSGEFVAFLDADDLWRPEKLERQVERFRANPELGLVSTLVRTFDDRGIHPPIPEEVAKRERLLGEPDQARSIFLRSLVGTPTVMVPRWVLDRVGDFDERLAIAEDDNLWIRIANVAPIDVVDAELVLVRKNPASLSRANAELLHRSVIQSIEILEREHPEIAARIADVIPRKRSYVLCDMGYLQFSEGRLGEARATFRRALSDNPRSRRAWTYLLLSLVPGPLVSSMRNGTIGRIARRLRGRS